MFGVFDNLSSSAGITHERSADRRKVAWSQARFPDLLKIGANGTVTRSRDAGRSWREVGDAPTASSSHAADFYVATRDGTIRISRDGGQTWTVRAEPPA